MSIRNITVGAVSIFCLLCVCWLSCSTNTGSSVGSPEAHSGGDITWYFPLNEGYSTTYEIRSSTDGIETATFKVGKEVSYLGTSAIEWFSYGDKGIDTTYFEVTDSALYYYSSSHYPREKILELPMEQGHSWSRYSQEQTDDDAYDDFTDIITENKYEEADDDTTINALGKIFPTIGSLDMTVEQIEQLELSSGSFYSNAVRISNSGTAGKKNYYWFVPGIGLVKYVIGATSESYPEGDIEGELITYGY